MAFNWFKKLKTGLSKSAQKVEKAFTSVIGKKKLDENSLTEIEEQLISSDLGVNASKKIVDKLRNHKFELTSKLKNSLEVVLMSSQYPHRYGNHIEDRGSMVNFSIVGRNCTQEQRENFFKWDEEKGERKKISTYIKQKFKDLDAVIGGQISIDIYPKGQNKAQVLDDLIGPITFFGDKCEPGGNDYPIAATLERWFEENNRQCVVHRVKDYKDTWNILKTY